MTASLQPCPSCHTHGAVADDGHAICRRCEGKETLADTNIYRISADYLTIDDVEQITQELLLDRNITGRILIPADKVLALKDERDHLREALEAAVKESERLSEALAWESLPDTAKAAAWLEHGWRRLRAALHGSGSPGSTE